MAQEVDLQVLDNSSWDPSVCVKEPVEAVPRAFVLRNFVTEDECTRILQRAEEVGFESFPKSIEYRNQDRMACLDQATARLIFDRLAPFMEDMATFTITADQASTYECTHSSEGTWHVSGVNNLLRVMRYPPGGHFAPHFDAFESFEEDMMSLFTILM